MKQSGLVSDDFKRVETHYCPMSTCAAPAGSPCRTGKGKVAIQYHTSYTESLALSRSRW
ncbi:hypothetical protein C9F11_46940 (plasmid) [Streptomyces sp. YIM 121038]|nr:hypothetical protein C9F11_46940 [Streptomyces sp. YIM 121038]